MDIKTLEGLRKKFEINGELEDKEIENLWDIVDEAIARQSVKGEEVAISKTETTSCEWCEEDFRYTQGGMEKRRFAEDDDTDYVDIECWGYCPVCGRRLEETT